MKSHPSRWKKASNGVKIYACLLEKQQDEETYCGIQILAPPNGLANLSNDDVLAYLVGATEIGKELEARGWKVFY